MEAEKRVPYTVVIDSASRNLTTFTAPNNYEIELPNAGYQNVASLELIQADIPASGYNVTRWNNVLRFQVSVNGTIPATDATIESVTIPEGIYQFTDAGTAATYLPTVINNLAGVANITAGSVNSVTRKVVFTITNGMRILSGGIATLLGFTQNTAAVGGGVISSNATYLTQPERFLTLKLTCPVDLKRCESSNSSVTGGFCIIPFDLAINNFGLLQSGNGINCDSLKIYFPQPSKLRSLRIEFLDPEGNLYDFQGRDHLLVFQINSISSALRA